MELKKGIFTISLDTELAWGTIDKPNSLIKNQKYYNNTRDVINKLLKLFEEYNITATWAIVGHLFLEECRINEKGLKHPEIIRSKTEWYDKDWFEYDPATNWKKDPLWYGPDIIEKIKNCKVPQEIASHSFSHMIFSNKNLKTESVESDIKMAVKLAKNMGIELKSFVFPRNEEGWLSILNQYNFVCYRGVENSWYKNTPSKLKKIFHMIDQTLAFTPPVEMPYLQNGLVNIPASMLYLSRDSFRKFIPMKSREIKAKRGINKAIQEKKVFHLWFHPHNIATDPTNLLKGIKNILEYVDYERGKGNLEVKSMIQIVNDLFNV